MDENVFDMPDLDGDIDLDDLDDLDVLDLDGDGMGPIMPDLDGEDDEV